MKKEAKGLFPDFQEPMSLLTPLRKSAGTLMGFFICRKEI